MLTSCCIETLMGHDRSRCEEAVDFLARLNSFSELSSAGQSGLYAGQPCLLR